MDVARWKNEPAFRRRCVRRLLEPSRSFDSHAWVLDNLGIPDGAKVTRHEASSSWSLVIPCERESYDWTQIYLYYSPTPSTRTVRGSEQRIGDWVLVRHRS